MSNHQNVNATASDTPSATQRTLSFSLETNKTKRNLCNFACNYTIGDIIAARIIDNEHADESSDKVQMELIYSILKDLLSHHRLTQVMNTVIQGTNTPVRVTTSGPSSDSKLTLLLFGIEYLFDTPP